MKRKIFFIVISLVLYFVSSVGCSVKSNSYIPGITHANNFIDNKIINIGFLFGGISTIQTNVTFDKKNHDKNLMMILGQTGFKVYDNSHEVDSINFINNDGKPIFIGVTPRYVKLNKTLDGIMMGGGGFGDVGLLDMNGKLLWNFDPGFMSNPYKMIAADLDNDELTEFYSVGNTGLYKLDIHGKVVWKIDGDMEDISTYSNSMHDIKSLIVLNSDGSFILISSSGKKIKKLDFNSKYLSFATVDINGTSLIVHRSSFDTIRVVNQNNGLFFDYTYKKLPVYHGPYATSVSFDGITTYIAILMTSRNTVHKSVISIFSLNGELVYQSILNSGRGLASQFINKTNKQRLLVSDGHKISVIMKKVY